VTKKKNVFSHRRQFHTSEATKEKLTDVDKIDAAFADARTLFQLGRREIDVANDEKCVDNLDSTLDLLERMKVVFENWSVEPSFNSRGKCYKTFYNRKLGLFMIS
jgi:hypothetical protein